MIPISVADIRKTLEVEVFFHTAKQELAFEKCHSDSEEHQHAHFELLFVTKSDDEGYTHGEMVRGLFHTHCQAREQPQGHSEGGLLIADILNHSIRYLIGGKVSTVSGTTLTGELNGVESKAELFNPTDVAVTKDGNILVADANNNKIREITPYHLPSALPADDSIKVVLGNKIMNFEAPPEFSNDRTMMPVRAISEALGYEVKYSEASGLKTVQLIKGNITVELYIDKTGIKHMEKNKADIEKTTDAVPYVKQNLTYVPVRFFAEQAGLDV